MREIVEGLKIKPVLKHTDVLLLKEYIGKKYSQTDNRAAILANAVHRIIDGQLPGFAEKSRAELRINILKKAVLKNHYTIGADEVFRACLVPGNNDEHYLKLLTTWVNLQQSVPVAQETLVNFINSIHRQSEDLLEHYDLDLVIDRLEELETTSVQPLPVFWSKLHRNKIPLAIAALVLLISLIGNILCNTLSPFSGSTLTVGNPGPNQVQQYSGIPNQLPAHLKYRPINETGLKDFLTKKNSLLAETPYFSAIIQAAEEFNVNPLLLFAIAGHEQAFVAKTHKDARKIANNPFNVYHSWREYNTDIRDSARIAARTVVNSSNDRPESVDPIIWINNKYAEDKNWWKGVSQILENLEKEVGEK